MKNVTNGIGVCLEPLNNILSEKTDTRNKDCKYKSAYLTMTGDQLKEGDAQVSATHEELVSGDIMYLYGIGKSSESQILIPVSTNGAISSFTMDTTFRSPSDFVRAGKRSSFCCCFCLELKTVIAHMKQHLRIHQISPGSCDRCGSVFSDKSNVMAHKTTCQIICEVPNCSRRHRSQSAVLKHS